MSEGVTKTRRRSAKQRQAVSTVQKPAAPPTSPRRRAGSSAPADRGDGGDGLSLLRTSERLAFKSCRWRWDQTYNAGLSVADPAPALRFGTLVHMALAEYYKVGIRRGPHPAVTFEKLYEEQLKTEAPMGWRDDDDAWQNAGDIGVDMLEHYVEVYGKDDEWRVIATEMPFKTLVRDNDGTRDYSFWYTGILDGLWQHRPSKKLWIADHKTTAGIGNSTTEHLVLDDQAGAYWSFGVQFLREKGYLKKDDRLAGMMYNFMRKTMRDTRPQNDQGQFLNKDGSVSKKQPSPYFLRHNVWRDDTDRMATVQRAIYDHREILLVKNGHLQVVKNPSQFTCRGCGLRDLCELHEVGGDWVSFREQTMKPWNGYAEHVIRNSEQK